MLNRRGLASNIFYCVLNSASTTGMIHHKLINCTVDRVTRSHGNIKRRNTLNTTGIASISKLTDTTVSSRFTSSACACCLLTGGDCLTACGCCLTACGSSINSSY